jgi:5-methylcytosine-specific restriction enzyme A
MTSDATARCPTAYCPLCDRPLPTANTNRHHLTPVSRGGRITVRMHKICHDVIHAHYTEREIQSRLADIDSLRADPTIAKFIEWVRTKPADFCTPTKKSNQRKRR